MILAGADSRTRIWMSVKRGRIAWAMHPAAMPRLADTVDEALSKALDGDLHHAAVIIWEGAK